MADEDTNNAVDLSLLGDEQSDDQTTDDQTTDDQTTDDQTTDDQTTDDQKTDDQKTDDQKTDDQKTDDQKTEETFDDFKFPDGLRDHVTEAQQTEFLDIAKEAKLTPEQARKVLDYHAKNVDTQVAEAQKRQAEQIEAWQKEVKDLPEASSVLRRAKLSLEKFAPPELKQFLQTSPMGSNPGLIKMLAKVGELVEEDTAAQVSLLGGGSSSKPRTEQDVAAALYNKS